LKLEVRREALLDQSLSQGTTLRHRLSACSQVDRPLPSLRNGVPDRGAGRCCDGACCHELERHPQRLGVVEVDAVGDDDVVGQDERLALEVLIALLTICIVSLCLHEI